MNRLILGGLAFLSIAMTPAIAQAQTRAISRVNSTNTRVSNSFQATPFQLVFLAYRGHFRDRGIPSYDAFLSAYQNGRISAKDIVSVGVEANRVSVQSTTDKGYLRAVESYLDSLVSGRS